MQRDLEAYFDWIAPEDPSLYTHNEEGPDDMPADLRTALTGLQLGHPGRGWPDAAWHWQGIYLFEHRGEAPRRKITLRLIGE